MDKRQYHLSGPHMSGRAVRMRVLDFAAVSSVSESVRKEADGQTDGVYAKVLMAGVGAAIFEISDPTTKKELPKLPEKSWHKVTAEKLDGKLSEFFTSKDVNFLCKVFDKLHYIDGDELEAIMGEGVALAD